MIGVSECVVQERYPMWMFLSCVFMLDGTMCISDDTVGLTTCTLTSLTDHRREGSRLTTLPMEDSHGAKIDGGLL